MGLLTVRRELLKGRDPLAQGCVAYFGLDESSGSFVADLSGNGNAGTFVGTPGHGPGKIGGGGVFSGSNYISVPVPQLFSGALSFSAWVNPVSTAQGLGVVSIFGDSISQFYAELGVEFGNNWCMNLYDGTNNPAMHASVAPSLGVWSHIVGVRTGFQGLILLYVNGVFIGSVVDTLTSTPTYSTLLINTRGAGSAHLTSSTDEIGIWNRAVTAAEIAALYNGGAGYRPQF